MSISRNPLRACVLLVLLVVLTGAAPSRAADAQTSAPVVDVGGELKRGNSAVRKGNYDDAVRWYNKALEKAPGHTDAQIGLSLALIKMRQYVRAAEVTVDLLNRVPGQPRALSLLGIALMRVGLLNEAEAAFVQAIQTNGSEPFAIAGLSELGFYQSDYASSLRLARRACRISPGEADFFFLLGQAAARQESFQEAADAYTQFLSVAPRVDAERRAKIRGLIDLYRALAGVRLYAVRGPESVDMPFELSSRHLPIVEATINGKGPFRFVIDTGSGFMVLSDETAAKLGVKPIAKGGFSQGVGGSGSFPIVYALLRSFGVGGITIDNVPTYIRKFYHNLPNPDGSLPPPADRVDGFIGLSVIARFNAAVDYSTHRFELRPKDVALAAPGPGDIVIPYRVTTGGMLSVPADIGAGPKLNFIVDTGATSTVVSTEAFDRFKLTDKVDKAARVRVTGAGGITEGVSVVVLDRLSLAGEVADSEVRRDFVRALVLDLGALNETAGFQQAGIIGSNVLRHYRLEFDFARGKLILRSPSPTQTNASVPGETRNVP